MASGPDLRAGLALLALVAGLSQACGGASETGADAARPAIPVETAEVAAEDVDVLVEAVGSLEADQRVEVKARRSGRIRSLPVSEGERVEQGTPLVQLDDRDLVARLDQAKAALAQAEVRVARAKRTSARSGALRKRGIASEQDHDDVQSEYDLAAAALGVARANLAFAKAELDETVVEAPFAGVFGRLRVDPGAFIAQGEPIGLLIDDDPLELVFALPERYIARLAPGLAVTARVSSLPERPFPGEITFVDPAVDAENRTVTVKAEVPNPDRLLRPGQFGGVEVRLERRENAPVVPEEAIVPTADRLLLFVVKDGNASARTVRTGVRLPGRVEIVSGVAPGETIVVTGHEKLREGEPAAVRAVAAPG
ncbi:MAG: efflux RND transporter periplasmic adaptor subunit [Candidatus Binatia bacterium]|nr:efflux RND transporter periplasmic adaptor subunit [Candidatus Binatia bacterium]